MVYILLSKTCNKNPALIIVCCGQRPKLEYERPYSKSDGKKPHILAHDLHRARLYQNILTFLHQYYAQTTVLSQPTRQYRRYF